MGLSAHICSCRVSRCHYSVMDRSKHGKKNRTKRGWGGTEERIRINKGEEMKIKKKLGDYESKLIKYRTFLRKICAAVKSGKFEFRFFSPQLITFVVVHQMLGTRGGAFD